MSATDPDAQRSEILERWEQAATGWRRAAGRTREHGMLLSSWMIDRAELQAGMDVVELAAGPGDTGFLAAEVIAPSGMLTSSDGAQAMVEVARSRAAEQGITNVEFKQLQLEWIDLPTASADVILCRWAVMLSLDPGAALQEMRRVLRSGGRAVVAVWDRPEINPWATIPTDVLVERGLAERPPAGGPGMFALSDAGELAELLETAGFVEVSVEPVAVDRRYDSVEDFLDETLDLSLAFSQVWAQAPESEWQAIEVGLAERLEPFRDASGYTLPGSSLGAVGWA